MTAKFVLNSPPVFNGHNTVVNVSFFRNENDQNPITQDYEVAGKNKNAIKRALGKAAKNLPPIPVPDLPDIPVDTVYEVQESGDVAVDGEYELDENRKLKRKAHGGE
jgi:hypothetical protein